MSRPRKCRARHRARSPAVLQQAISSQHWKDYTELHASGRMRKTSAWSHLPILLACGTVLSALDLWGKGWRGQGRSTGHAEHTQESTKTKCTYGNYETQPNTVSGRQHKFADSADNPWFVPNLSRICVLLMLQTLYKSIGTRKSKIHRAEIRLNVLMFCYFWFWDISIFDKMLNFSRRKTEFRDERVILSFL